MRPHELVISETTADREWEEMVRKYIERVPRPVYKESPPLKTSLEEQLEHEEEEERDE